MTARLTILTVGILLVATGAGAQSPGAQSGGGALGAILFRGAEGATGALSENSKKVLEGLLLGETTTFPTGTSAGGFTWTFDDSLHVPIRRSRSFGPMFAERAFTTRVSVSAGPLPPASRATGASATDDTVQILRTLQRYRAAYEALDARAVAAVYPDVNVSNLQAAFAEFSKMTYDLRIAVDGVVIAADGQTASVNASETIRPVTKSVRVAPRTGIVLFLLKKVGGDWTIQSVKSDVRR